MGIRELDSFSSWESNAKIEQERVKMGLIKLGGHANKVADMVESAKVSVMKSIIQPQRHQMEKMLSKMGEEGANERFREKRLSFKEKFDWSLSGPKLVPTLLGAAITGLGTFLGCFGDLPMGAFVSLTTMVFIFVVVPETRPLPKEEIPVDEMKENLSSAGILSFVGSSVGRCDFLTEDMCANMTKILCVLERVLPRFDGELLDERGYTVRMTALDYLPRLLADYSAIPEHARKKDVGGSSPELVLSKSLAQMSNSLEKIEEGLDKGDVSTFVANSMFLKERFGGLHG